MNQAQNSNHRNETSTAPSRTTTTTTTFEAFAFPLHQLLENNEWGTVQALYRNQPNLLTNIGMVHNKTSSSSRASARGGHNTISGTMACLTYPFHLAIERDAPQWLLRDMLDFSRVYSPEGSVPRGRRTISNQNNSKNLCALRDVSGRYPLHCILLRLYQQKGKQKQEQQTPVQIIQMILDRYPAAAQTVDPKTGYFPLHIACSRNAPATIIQSLLHAHPAAASMITTCEEQSGTKQLPIHMICHHANINFKSIQALLACHPSSCRVRDGKHGCLPLHYCCMAKSTNATKAASSNVAVSSDPNGSISNTGSSEAVKVVKLLLREYPRGAAVRDDHGCLPLLVAVRNMNASASSSSSSGSNNNNCNNNHANAASMAKIIDLLLQAYPEAAKVSDGTARRLPLHWACSIVPSATASSSSSSLGTSLQQVIEQLLLCYPEGSMQQEQKYGLLPLHVVCKSGLCASSVGVAVVGLLLAAFRKGARTMDDGGSLPLHYAVQNRNVSVGVVIALLLAFPKSVRVKDGSTGRTPLELAKWRRCGSEVVQVLNREPAHWEAMSPPSSKLDDVLSLNKSFIFSGKANQKLSDQHSVQQQEQSEQNVESEALLPSLTADGTSKQRQKSRPSNIGGFHPMNATKAFAAKQQKATLNMKCVVCLERNACNVLYPCGHACLCNDCSTPEKLVALRGVCPVGRCRFQDVIRVYGKIMHDDDS